MITCLCNHCLLTMQINDKRKSIKPFMVKYILFLPFYRSLDDNYIYCAVKDFQLDLWQLLLFIKKYGSPILQPRAGGMKT